MENYNDINNNENPGRVGDTPPLEEESVAEETASQAETATPESLPETTEDTVTADFPADDGGNAAEILDNGPDNGAASPVQAPREPAEPQRRNIPGFNDTSAYKRRRTWPKVLIFIVLAVVLVGGTALLTSYLLTGDAVDGIISAFEVPDDDDDTSDTDDDLWIYVESDSDDDVETTIEAWPYGDGTQISVTELSDDAEELTLQEIYKKCTPSVVYIITTADDGMYSGTGIVITEDGYIVTNYHVVEGCYAASVTLYDDTEYDAYLVGYDDQTDIAVLKIDAEGLTAAEFGDSESLEVGESVVAIGNPLSESFRGTMTDGIISALNRDIQYGNYTMTLIQTNAAINSGNSGGPLINMYGQVIGITNMKMVSESSSVEGIGFAIPSSTAVSIINEILENGSVIGRPGVGILAMTVTDTMMETLELPAGVYVESVYEGTDAYEKGLQEGDVITAVDGVAITTLDELSEIKNSLSVGDVLTFTVYRDGEYFDVDVALCDMNDFS